MKTGTVIGVIVVVAVVIAVGYVAFKPQSTEAPTQSPEPEFQDDTTESGSDLGQFIQEQPSVPAPEDEPSDEESTTTAVVEEVTISMDEQGFDPSEITVAVGTTVTFVNNGQAAHWPASDVHPTHKVLPTFDAKSGLETGETYSYTFKEAGEWGMHDHLFPQFRGTITVQ